MKVSNKIGLTLLTASLVGCNSNKSASNSEFPDSVALKSAWEVVSEIERGKSMDDRGWPSTVKGLPHYHLEKPILRGDKIVGYMIRDFLSDTVATYEDFHFREGSLVLYQFDQFKKGLLAGKGKYWFENGRLIDSFTILMQPFSRSSVLAKADNRYFLAKNRIDSLQESVKLLKHTLDQLRSMQVEE
jgi:hypothetical protein